MVELQAHRLALETEHRIAVRYRDVMVGEFIADMIIEKCVMVEVKAVRTLARIHEVQLVNYLVATGVEIGLLLNFGSSSMEYRRKYRIYSGTP